MRALYLDETGIGKLDHEPLLVIAGVLIHQDTHWRPMAEYLKALLAEATPRGEAVPTFLHAKDIYHGSGEFPRERWPREVRMALLDALADMPWKFGVPVVWGSADRRKYAEANPDDSHQSHLVDCYAVAAVTCFMQAEWYMRNCVPAVEVASVTFERNTALQKRVKEIFAAAKDQGRLEAGIDNPGALAELLPLTKLIDSPNYQDKDSASILQLADFCAWSFNRASRKARDYQRFAKPLSRTAMLWRPGQNPPITAPVWRPSPVDSRFRVFSRTSPLRSS